MWHHFRPQTRHPLFSLRPLFFATTNVRDFTNFDTIQEHLPEEIKKNENIPSPHLWQ